MDYLKLFIPCILPRKERKDDYLSAWLPRNDHYLSSWREIKENAPTITVNTGLGKVTFAPAKDVSEIVIRFDGNRIAIEKAPSESIEESEGESDE